MTASKGVIGRRLKFFYTRDGKGKLYYIPVELGKLYSEGILLRVFNDT